MSSELSVITKSKIVHDLKSLGLKEGETVMVHSALKSIGWIVGGPDVVIAAILEVIGPSGTIMMLAGWEDNPYSLETWDDDKKEAYLKECPPFDKDKSRADHRDFGILTEYLRTWSGAHRSSHPESSYVAVGKNAQYITENHPWDYREGNKSPLAKFCSLEGKVLVLGSPLCCINLLHHAEFLAKVDNKRMVRYKLPVLINGKKVWTEFEESDSSNGIADWPIDYFEVIGKEYISAKGINRQTVGHGESYLFDAKTLLGFGIEWMEQHF